MKDFDKKIKFFASRIRMTDEEQANIKDAMLRQIFARREISNDKRQVSPFSMWMKFVPTALMIVFILGGSVSYAARDTLPGDLLYPFKLGVTEKVQGMLLVSTKEQAKFEIILIERRAEEAIKLTQTGKLDEKANASIALSIDKHTESINSKVEELKVDDKLAAKEVASTLAVSLTEQSEKIVKVATESAPTTSVSLMTTTTEPAPTESTNNVDIAPLAVKIQEIADDATEQKAVIEAEILLDPAGPELGDIDEEKIDEGIEPNLLNETYLDDFEDPANAPTLDPIKDDVKGTTIENEENLGTLESAELEVTKATKIIVD